MFRNSPDAMTTTNMRPQILHAKCVLILFVCLLRAVLSTIAARVCGESHYFFSANEICEKPK